MKRIGRVIGAGLVGLLLLPTASFAELIVGNLQQESFRRIDRTVYEYTYSATLTNTGPAVTGGTIATVTSTSRYTTIVNGELIFRATETNGTRESTNTITIRHDRRYPFAVSNLVWNTQPLPESIPGPGGGVLLGGAPSSAAIDALSFRLESPVAEEDITDGLLLTRLEATLSPTATVAEVNGVLLDANASVATMIPRMPFVTLVIPRAADQGQVNAIADALVSTGIFVEATPSFAPELNEVPSHWTPASDTFDHLELIHAPAAWNLRDHAHMWNESRIPVVVADSFYSLNTPVDMTPVHNLGGREVRDFDSETLTYDGNHGPAVMSVIGAQFENGRATAVHPDPDSGLALGAVSLGGYSMRGILQLLADTIDKMPNDRKFVINTSFGFSSQVSSLDRAKLAMVWKGLVGHRAVDFLHATAAGNNPSVDSRTFSPFALAARYANPCDSVEGIIDWARCVFSLRTAARSYPNVSGPALNNVMVVASVDNNGNPSNFTSLNWDPTAQTQDIAAGGEGVYVLCQILDETPCNGETGNNDGTSFAAPQVAAVAAFLWNLHSHLSVSQVIEAIKKTADHTKNIPVLDMYKAVLSLDSTQRPAIREALLDSVPDSQVGIDDLERFVSEYTGPNKGEKNFSRYDLNGDGYTGNDTIRRESAFDLNSDGNYFVVDLELEGNLIQLNESALTDEEILCYFAYSSALGYSVGGEAERRTAMKPILHQCGVVGSLELYRQSFSGSGDYSYSFNGQFLNLDNTAEWRRQSSLNNGNGVSGQLDVWVLRDVDGEVISTFVYPKLLVTSVTHQHEDQSTVESYQYIKDRPILLYAFINNFVKYSTTSLFDVVFVQDFFDSDLRHIDGKHYMQADMNIQASEVTGLFYWNAAGLHREPRTPDFPEYQTSYSESFSTRFSASRICDASAWSFGDGWFELDSTQLWHAYNRGLNAGYCTENSGL